MNIEKIFNNSIIRVAALINIINISKKECGLAIKRLLSWPGYSLERFRFSFFIWTATISRFFYEAAFWAAQVSTSFKLIGIKTAESGSFVRFEQKFQKGVRTL